MVFEQRGQSQSLLPITKKQSKGNPPNPSFTWLFFSACSILSSEFFLPTARRSLIPGTSPARHDSKLVSLCSLDTHYEKRWIAALCRLIQDHERYRRTGKGSKRADQRSKSRNKPVAKARNGKPL